MDTIVGNSAQAAFRNMKHRMDAMKVKSEILETDSSICLHIENCDLDAEMRVLAARDDFSPYFNCTCNQVCKSLQPQVLKLGYQTRRDDIEEVFAEFFSSIEAQIIAANSANV